MSRFESLALTAGLLALALLLAFILYTVYWRANFAPCGDLGWMSQKNLPARCISYWERP